MYYHHIQTYTGLYLTLLCIFYIHYAYICVLEHSHYRFTKMPYCHHLLQQFFQCLCMLLQMHRLNVYALFNLFFQRFNYILLDCIDYVEILLICVKLLFNLSPKQQKPPQTRSREKFFAYFFSKK